MQNPDKNCVLSLYSYVCSAVQTPVLSPPAPAPAKKTPAPAKKTPAPGKKLRLRQKILGLCKFVKIGNFYSLNWKSHLCFFEQALCQYRFQYHTDYSFVKVSRYRLLKRLLPLI